MTLAEQIGFTLDEMIRLAAAMDARWDEAGKAHAKSRITLARRILESPDVEFAAERNAIAEALDTFQSTPPPPPPPEPSPSSYWDARHGAVVNVAGNASAELTWNAGVREIFFEMTQAANLAEMKLPRWAEFVQSGFFVTRTKTDSVEAAKAEAQFVVSTFAANAMRALLIDTEQWKADVVPSGPKLTDAFYGELRALLGPAVPIANVTYGWHQDASVVPRDTLEKHNIERYWEAYNGDALSWDLRSVAVKLNLQGEKPARVSLGHKMLPAHVPLHKQLAIEGRVKPKTILWDVSLGPAVEAFANGVKLS
jgi:hypothetical protein